MSSICQERKRISFYLHLLQGYFEKSAPLGVILTDYQLSSWLVEFSVHRNHYTDYGFDIW